MTSLFDRGQIQPEKTLLPILNVLMMNLTLAFLALRMQTPSSALLAKSGNLNIRHSSMIESLSPLVFGRNLNLLIDHARLVKFLQTPVIVNQQNYTYAGYFTQRPPDLTGTYDVLVQSSWFVQCSAGAPYDHGGAICVLSGSLTVDTSLFANCTTVRQSANGGAICSTAATNTITNTCFNNCSSRGQGQALFLENSASTTLSMLTLQLCSFSSLVYGSSGLYVMDGNPGGSAISGLAVSNINSTRNTARAEGGGISLALSYVSGTLSYCNFNSNYGKSIVWLMVSNNALTVSMTSFNFASNVADGRGLIDYFGSQITLSNSVFRSNFGTTLAALSGQAMTITNCLFDYINATGTAAPAIAVTASPATLSFQMFLADYCYASVLPSATGTGWVPTTSSSGGGGGSSSATSSGGTAVPSQPAAGGGDSMSTGLIVTIAICIIELLVIIAVLLILVLFIRKSSWGRSRRGPRSPPRRHEHRRHRVSDEEKETSIAPSEGSSQQETEMDTEQIPDEGPSNEPDTEEDPAPRRKRRIRRRRRIETDGDEENEETDNSAKPSEPSNDSGSPLITKRQAPVPLRRKVPARRNVTLDWSSSGED